MLKKNIVCLLLSLVCNVSFSQTIFSIRNDGVILKNNQPFFPIGFYIDRGTVDYYKTEIHAIASGGTFNVVNLPYVGGNEVAWTSFLNLCTSKNIYVISQLDYAADFTGPITTFKNHPAICGWSVADDADNNYFTTAQLQARHNQIKAADPNHITDMSLTGYYLSRRELANNYTAIADIPSFQIYPISPLSDYDVTPTNALTETYLRTLLYVNSAATFNKSLIMNNQVFNWSVIGSTNNPRFPTAAEARNMTYSGMAAGIKGIISYVHNTTLENQVDLWNETITLQNDLSILKNILVDGVLTRVNTGNTELICSYWKYNNAYYVAVINTSYSNSQTLNLTIPNTNSFQLQSLFTRMPSTLTFSGNILTGNISPTDVQVYKLSASNNNGTITYSADNTTNIANPERGWHIQFETCADVNENLNESDLVTQRLQNKITLVKKNYNLRLYKNAPLAQTFLDLLQNDLNKCRNAGVKLIPLFRYNACEGEPAPNAPIERIFEHMDQLATIFTNNNDVIAWVKAGFIGAYGEWHDADDPTLLTMPKKGQILNKLLSVLPTNRMVSLRYAKDKREIYNQNPITLSEAHNGTNKSRVGHENDSFGSNGIDYGTYYFGEGAGQAPDIELVKTYLEQENNFVPQGGETSGLCGILPSDFIYHECNYALLTMQRLKYTSISHYELFDVNAPCNTIPIWANGGCEPEMRRKLGYRFRLTEATIPSSISIANNLQLNFKIANDGWANPINPRGLQIVLRNKVTNEEFFIIINDGINNLTDRTLDPRFWALNTTTTVTINKPLPANIPAGEYDLFIHLFAPENSIKNRPEYAIRLANNNVWESTTGYNSLLASITVNGSVLALDTSTLNNNLAKAKNKSILIFPNPTKENTTISYFLSKKSNVQISIFDAAGRLVKPTISKNQEAGNHLQKIGTNTLPNGIYFVHIALNNVKEVRKIVVNK